MNMDFELRNQKNDPSFSWKKIVSQKKENENQ